MTTLTTAFTLIRQIQGYLRWGSGTPESVVDAPYGAIFLRTDTGDIYRKRSALGTLTGWAVVP